MSERYTGAWLQDGAFNPLSVPVPSNKYIQYGGVWTTSQAADAVASGTWAKVTQPHLYSWGDNNNGQLGLGNTTNYSSPNQVGSLTNWLNIASGSYFSFIIKTDGTLWSWGQNVFGQLGLNNITYYSSPKQVGSLTNWLNVSCGAYHSIVTKTDGTLWAWGRNNFGQLGLGNTTNYSSPKQVGSLKTWTAINMGSSTLGIHN